MKKNETKSPTNIRLLSRRTRIGQGIIPLPGSPAKNTKTMGQPKTKNCKTMGQPNTEKFCVRRVPPVEQMTAIAKSVLERQTKPKNFSISTSKGITIIGKRNQ